MGSKKNDLATRMKRYELSYNTQLPPRGYIIVRLDGKGFSKYTKSLDKPFDLEFSHIMDETTKYLCEKLNPKFAYTQSDEISLVFADFENPESINLYDGKVQKITSISASNASSKFNQLVIKNAYNKLRLLPEQNDEAFELIDVITKGSRLADFDSRVLYISDYREVFNYFVWRQIDCTRNSISMAHHAALGHEKGVGKSGTQKQEELFSEAGINWNDYPTKFKRGSLVYKEKYLKTQVFKNETLKTERSRWSINNETPIFTQLPEILHKMTPIMGK